MGGRQILAATMIATVLALPAAGGTPVESPHARFARASRMIEAGQLEQAYAMLEKLADDYPRRWEGRARRKMIEIKKIVAAREQAREQADNLRDSAEAARGQARAWMLLESARVLFAARLYAEALKDASAAVGKPGTRFRPGALLLAARCGLKLGKGTEAEQSYRGVLADKLATREQRGAAWNELAELLGRSGRREELGKLLEEHIRRGPEEPGVRAAVNRYVSELLVDEKHSLRVGRVLWGVVRKWPAGSVRFEWVLVAARVAEFIAHDYSRADKLYRLMLERHPEACFDLTLLKSGRRGGDRGREVVIADIGRVEKKKKGELKPLTLPKAGVRGATAVNALAAVLCGLRDGDLDVARECAAGKLARELRVKTYPFRRYALSDYRVQESKVVGPEAADVSYEVAGELGVTRVLKLKAMAVCKGGVWKISDLGM